MTMEKGTNCHIEEIESLYNELNDYLDAHINYPGWKKGIYPIKETAIKGIQEGNLYVLKDGSHIAGTVILRREQEVAYSKVDWKIHLAPEDILVIHTFAVHPAYLKKGIGTKIMDFIIEHSKAMNIKAIRLDVYEKNQPAINLYKKYDFAYIDTVDLGYSEYGLEKFELYQKLL
ncbi:MULTISPECIES: GNAT family N-acetyltransferase [Lysinibacillus]|uniref:GNAT family N-acetyltransferase n=2 Tax=Lysinibacillus TaxID=400634 RepID=A0ABY2T862_9BACI|nr:MULTISPECIES: GNAT family N-acetyltransferase [Lysinibacillus]AHN23685.1 acetyltransferase [Lysinibacillus varians]TKI46638.1 GNAT family N-acetyltransferase [Lysinibacillus tabacifolii]TKI60603.1 GNAT family N-acetyltransferase [Lysinibacillus varians]